MSDEPRHTHHQSHTYLAGERRSVAAKHSVTLPLLAPDGNQWPCTLTFRPKRRDFEHAFDFSSEQLGTLSFEDTDLFNCLISLRRWLEPQGWRILCNGARANAWPSGMARSMGGGGMVYLFGSEERRRHGPNLVRTFDEAPAELVVTVEEQLAYPRPWPFKGVPATTP
jgi:hypothetical protein